MNAIGEGDEEDEDLFSEAKKVAPNEQRASATSVRSNRKPSPNSLIKLLGTKSKLDRSKMSVNGVHFAHLRHGNDDELTFNMQCQVIQQMLYRTVLKLNDNSKTIYLEDNIPFNILHGKNSM